MRKGTLYFLIRGEGDDLEVLLAMKKRGFGQGKWNGCGGKVKEAETVEQAAIREAREEIGITPRDLKKMAVLTFTFPDVPKQKSWDQEIHVFVGRTATGEIQETEEMRPQWFAAKKLPFEKMWIDDPYWLPAILAGQKMRAEFVFAGKGESLKTKRIKITESFE